VVVTCHIALLQLLRLQKHCCWAQAAICPGFLKRPDGRKFLGGLLTLHATLVPEVASIIRNQVGPRSAWLTGRLAGCILCLGWVFAANGPGLVIKCQFATAPSVLRMLASLSQYKDVAQVFLRCAVLCCAVLCCAVPLWWSSLPRAA
jgi:hypothetical protein